MTIRKWIVAAIFAWSALAGWGLSAVAECKYPFLADATELTLVEVTRDGEEVEDLTAWKESSGTYGLIGYYFGVQMAYEGDDGSEFRVSFSDD